MLKYLKITLSWQNNSLKTRLMISAFLTIIMVLPIIGITLNNAFEKQIRNSLKKELRAYSYSILAVAEVHDHKLYMPDQLLDNQLNVSQTGLYVLITQADKKKVLWRSKSLLGLADPINLPTPTLGKSIFSEIKIGKKTHLIYSFSVSFGRGSTAFPLTLHIIEDQTPFLAAVAEFNHVLWTWLIILMVLLIIVQIVWLTWTLKPLHKLQQELEQVEQGRITKLVQHYPQELKQVTNQLNVLLTTEQNQRQRYRNALADLAHSLKTPLAVMQSQTDLSSYSQEQLTLIDQMIEHQLKRAQSAGQAAWHLGILVQPIVTKLINTLTKIYHQKHIMISGQIDPELSFKGDEADLMEILGNLLDNACKAAVGKVELTAKIVNNTILFSVDDDGNGVAIELRASILQRGIRADTYQQGHGIGLAIVRDLVASYDGELVIAQSSTLGGASFRVKIP